MPTQAQFQSSDLAFLLLRWNGVDVPGIGTTLNLDYALYRNCGGRSAADVPAFYQDGFDAAGWYPGCQAFEQSATKHKADGTRIQLLIEDQRDAADRLLAAMAYGNPLITSGHHAGLTMIDSALISLFAPLSLISQDWTPNGDGTYSQITVDPTHPDHGGFPVLQGQSNPTHTVDFWLMQGIPALLMLNSSAFAATVSPTFGVTYSAQIAAVTPQFVSICRWMIYGGSASYVSPTVPVAGIYAGGVRQGQDDAQDAPLTHRRWAEAATYISMYQLLIQATGQAAPDLLFWAQRYAAVGLQAQSQAGFFPENAYIDGMGQDPGYNMTSGQNLSTCIQYWPDSDGAFRDNVLTPALWKCLAWEATKIWQAPGFDADNQPVMVGTLGISAACRDNPYTALRGIFKGLFTGFPIVFQGPGQFQYTGETLQAVPSGTVGGAAPTQPKLPDFGNIGRVLLRGGSISILVIGTDAHHYQPMGVNVAKAQAWAPDGPYVPDPAPQSGGVTTVAITIPGAPSRVVDGAGGYLPETRAAATAWIGRIYRNAQVNAQFKQLPNGSTTLDNVRVLSFRYEDNFGQVPTINVKQRITLPTGENALILRVRSYPSGIQCDFESGAV